MCRKLSPLLSIKSADYVGEGIKSISFVTQIILGGIVGHSFPPKLLHLRMLRHFCWTLNALSITTSLVIFIFEHVFLIMLLLGMKYTLCISFG